MSLKVDMDQPRVDVVFSGTVVHVQQRDAVLVMTFAVDQVWKGSVSKRVMVYRPIPRPGGPPLGSGGLRPCDMGGRFIVLAHLLNTLERGQFGVDVADSHSLATSMCGDGSRPYWLAEEHGDLKALGLGREPQ